MANNPSKRKIYRLSYFMNLKSKNYNVLVTIDGFNSFILEQDKPIKFTIPRGRESGGLFASRNPKQIRCRHYCKAWNRAAGETVRRVLDAAFELQETSGSSYS